MLRKITYIPKSLISCTIKKLKKYVLCQRVRKKNKVFSRKQKQVTVKLKNHNLLQAQETKCKFAKYGNPITDLAYKRFLLNSLLCSHIKEVVYGHLLIIIKPIKSKLS